MPAKRTAVKPEGGSIVDSPADVVVIEDVAVDMEVVSPPGLEVEPEELEVGPGELEDEPEELEYEAVVVEGDDGEVGPEPSQNVMDG